MNAETIPAPAAAALSDGGPTDAEPEQAQAANPAEAMNASGEVERVWYNRSVAVGWNWGSRIPARVLRRTERKARVVFPQRDPQNRDVWKFCETWVFASSLEDRPAEASHTAKAQYPDF